MAHIILSQGLVGSATKPNGSGRGYVRVYKPEAHDGQGSVIFTDKAVDALRFDTFEDAMTFIMQVPANRRLRADGLPNRPIRAFTLEIVRVA